MRIKIRGEGKCSSKGHASVRVGGDSSLQIQCQRFQEYGEPKEHALHWGALSKLSSKYQYCLFILKSLTSLAL